MNKIIKEKMRIAEEKLLKYETWKEQAHWIVTDALYCVNPELALNEFIEYLDNPNTSKNRNDFIEFFENYEWIPDDADTDDIEEEKVLKANKYILNRMV